MAKITDLESLREIYPNPKGRSVEKQLSALDLHCERFIALSPFVVLASAANQGLADISPRGETPGFVKVLDSKSLIIPDRPGNNRLDTLTNILENPVLSVLFMIPGVDETLRVNGVCEIRTDNDLLEKCVVDGKRPRSVLKLAVKEAYLHCAKALMRSNLWSPESIVDRGVLPTMGKMINDQTGSQDKPETQEDMRQRYMNALY
ncbi:MAG: pyridoxamine 5'-phosphate oxidase family protein [Alphaproteobacteria bacterium]|nr:pyridoxamine 5'-phosphate oxidase family protein [Alphaproteobacteria bacterium]